MNLARADALVERGANALEGLARSLAADGGAKAQLAGELLEDAEFLRKLKPSLIAARARGETPPPTPPDRAITQVRRPLPNPKPASAAGAGPNPFVVVAAAFVAGIVLAKLLDWRGHAHPRG